MQSLSKYIFLIVCVLTVSLYSCDAGDSGGNNDDEAAETSNPAEGVETTHLSHLYAFMTLEMIPVSVHKGISPLGASAVASRNGAGVFDKEVRLGIEEDLSGIDSAKQIMNRAVELAKLIKKQ